MSEPAQLLVPVVANANTAPLVLADSEFLAALSNTEKRVGALAISDVATYSSAVGLFNDLTATWNKLEASRVALKAPFLEIERKIDACAKAPLLRITTLKDKVRAVQVYELAQRESAAKAERARHAEILRLEGEKNRQAAEARKTADAEAALLAPSDLDFDDGPPPEAPKTAIDHKIEALKFAPAIAPQKVAGVKFRVRLVAFVEDVAKLPEAFVIKSANDALIRETYCAGYKEGQDVPVLPGVKFTVDRTPIPTGKGGDLF